MSQPYDDSKLRTGGGFTFILLIVLFLVGCYRDGLHYSRIKYLQEDVSELQLKVWELRWDLQIERLK